MQLTYPNNIRNATKSSHTELNDDFTAITDIVNKAAGPHGNLQGDNVSPTAQLTGVTITVTTKIITAVIDANGTLTIKLADAAGAHSVKFQDHNGATRLEVKSNGEVEVK